MAHLVDCKMGDRLRGWADRQDELRENFVHALANDCLVGPAV